MCANPPLGATAPRQRQCKHHGGPLGVPGRGRAGARDNHRRGRKNSVAGGRWTAIAMQPCDCDRSIGCIAINATPKQRLSSPRPTCERLTSQRIPTCTLLQALCINQHPEPERAVLSAPSEARRVGGSRSPPRQAAAAQLQVTRGASQNIQEHRRRVSDPNAAERRRPPPPLPPPPATGAAGCASVLPPCRSELGWTAAAPTLML